MRITKRLAAVASAAALASGGIVACGGPDPTGPGPCTNNYFQAEMAVVDNLGNIAGRMFINETVCITPLGWIVSNTGTQEYHNVGAYNLFGPVQLELHSNNDAAGDTGPWKQDRTFQATWNADLLAGFHGIGYHVGFGSCYLQGHMASFAGDIKIQSASGYCTKMNTRVWG